MSGTLTLRPAMIDDAGLLLAWRNDPQTRQGSLTPGEVALAGHLAWLQAAIDSPDRQLMVAELDGDPVGTVRADREGEGWKLSWTVAPAARGRGLASRMVRKLAEGLREPLHAEVKRDNPASSKVALAAGLMLEAEIDGVLHYRRAARPVAV